MLSSVATVPCSVSVPVKRVFRELLSFPVIQHHWLLERRWPGRTASLVARKQVTVPHSTIGGPATQTIELIMLCGVAACTLATNDPVWLGHLHPSNKFGLLGGGIGRAYNCLQRQRGWNRGTDTSPSPCIPCDYT